jgi:hypothetical protein
MDMTLAHNITFAAGLIPDRIVQMGGEYSPGFTWFGIWLAALLTLCMYSFLYKDNPAYKFGEHLYVGTSVGYMIVITWYNVMWPNLFKPLISNPGFYWYLIIPAILGVCMLFRFVKQYTWVSRYALAYYVSLGAGLAIPAIIQAYVLRHMWSTFVPLWVPISSLEGSFMSKLGDATAPLVIFIGVLSVLIYFFFSLEHKGFIGRVSQVGIYFLMITFGSSFGYTVMARISLLIGRMQFLLEDWMGLKLG